jgi:hypothetical protein
MEFSFSLVIVELVKFHVTSGVITKQCFNILNKTAFLTHKNSLVTTPLVTWNFTNFTIFIFIFNTITCIRTIS